QLLYFYLSLSSSPSFFLNDTATTEIYTLSLHDALPICCKLSTALTWWVEWNERGALSAPPNLAREGGRLRGGGARRDRTADLLRSEEHTSELQSRGHLVCRLLLEKKKNNYSQVINARDV